MICKVSERSRDSTGPIPVTPEEAKPVLPGNCRRVSYAEGAAVVNKRPVPLERICFAKLISTPQGESAVLNKRSESLR